MKIGVNGMFHPRWNISVFPSLNITRHKFLNGDWVYYIELKFLWFYIVFNVGVI